MAWCLPESQFFEGHQLVDDQGVIEEELLSADDGQVGEEVLEGTQSVDAVEEEVAGDLAELRVRVVQEPAPRLLVLFDEDDVDEAFHHRAVLQLPQPLDRVPNIHARANYIQIKNHEIPFKSTSHELD